MDLSIVDPESALLAMNRGRSWKEGHSITTPPLFNGYNYLYWKTRMRIFIQAFDTECWKVIVRGPIMPWKKVDEKLVPKFESEYDDTDWKSIQLNAKAMNILHCGLDANVSQRVFLCDSAKEIWDTLEFIYGGNDKVKQIKVFTLMGNYENFNIKPEESIREMDARFTYIINSLKALGEIIDEDRHVFRILTSLPKKWISVATVLLEKTLTYDELISILLAHEERLFKMKPPLDR